MPHHTTTPLASHGTGTDERDEMGGGKEIEDEERVGHDGEIEEKVPMSAVLGGTHSILAQNGAHDAQQKERDSGLDETKRTQRRGALQILGHAQSAGCDDERHANVHEGQTVSGRLAKARGEKVKVDGGDGRDGHYHDAVLIDADRV